MPSNLFDEINNSRIKFYIANAVTLGLYGAIWVVFKAKAIGKLCNANFPNFLVGLLLTVLTIGIYPGVMLSVLAYKLTPKIEPNFGHIVLALNLGAFITAFPSGLILVFISVALWTHAVWLVTTSFSAINWQEQ